MEMASPVAFSRKRWRMLIAGDTLRLQTRRRHALFEQTRSDHGRACGWQQPDCPGVRNCRDSRDQTGQLGLQVHRARGKTRSGGDSINWHRNERHQCCDLLRLGWIWLVESLHLQPPTLRMKSFTLQLGESGIARLQIPSATAGSQPHSTRTSPSPPQSPCSRMPGHRSCHRFCQPAPAVTPAFQQAQHTRPQPTSRQAQQIIDQPTQLSCSTRCVRSLW